MNKIQEKEQELNERKKKRLAEIKTEPNVWKRFWKYIGFWVGYIWVVIWNELKDWRTALLFFIVCAVISVEVWLPLGIGLVTNNNYLKSFAGVCWAFWLLPGTPFLPLCLVITLFLKKIIDKKMAKNCTKTKIVSKCVAIIENSEKPTEKSLNSNGLDKGDYILVNALGKQYECLWNGKSWEITEL